MALGDFLFPHAELKLIVARSFETDIESVKDKLSSEYQDSAAIVKLNKADLQRLGLKDGSSANVKAKAGSIVVRAFRDDMVPEGTAVIPHGPWALALVSVPDDDSPPRIHGVTVTVMRTDDKVTSVDELLESP
ncbi:MAG: molybdopterin dinucleotide binding domain-containing protein [Candidatus Thorarchaeota archaeon]